MALLAVTLMRIVDVYLVERHGNYICANIEATEKETILGVIKFTQKDLDRNRPFEAGWKQIKITGNVDRLSKKKDSINHVVQLEVALDDGEVREFEHTFSEKAIGMMEPFITAMIGHPAETDVDYDLDAFTGSEGFAEFTKEIFKDPNNPNDRGRPVNKIVGWANKDNPPF